MPTKYAVRLSRTAEEDIGEIWEFIAEDSVDEAAKFITKLEGQVSSLERFPERCPLIAENQLLHARYRHLVFGNYRTVFRVAGRTVYIMRVIHSARLLDPTILETVDTD